MTSQSDDDTDRKLIARMAALPKEAHPTTDLWVEIEDQIGTGWADPRPRTTVIRRRWLQAAAVIGIFAAGALSGSLATRIGPRVSNDLASMDEAFGLAAEVQRTGTEYVAALAAFTEAVDSLSSDVRGQGTDAGLAAFLGAADQLAVLGGGPPGPIPASRITDPSNENRVRF